MLLTYYAIKDCVILFHGMSSNNPPSLYNNNSNTINPWNINNTAWHIPLRKSNKTAMG